MKNNLVLKIVIGVLIIAVAGLAVKLVMTKPTVQTNVAKPTTTITLAPSVSVTTKTLSLMPNEWKTYQDKQSGYNISYPPSWKSPISGWVGGWTAGTSLDANNYCIVDILKYPTETALTEWPNGEISDLVKKGYIKTNINIGGLVGIRLVAQPSKAGLTEVVYISSDNYTTRIGRNRGFESKIETECIDNFNQMINTFKFLP